MTTNIYETFEQAFIANIQDCYTSFDFAEESRTGKQFEIISLPYKVRDPRTFVFRDKKLGRISYEYAEDFYSWMMNGSTDEDTKLLSEKYPHTSRFLDKPKSKELPDNFNVFYGPRILRQLPRITEELGRNGSRRAVIQILQEEDQVLLGSDETLEYPCCDSVAFFIRENKLQMHVHMRSNNMANVAKLDMYIWGRFMCEYAEQLGLDVGIFSSSVASAHIFESDIPYLKKIEIL